MERTANYALVGLLTTVGLMLGLVLALWLGGGVDLGRDRYRVVFKGPVKGLADGSEVLFNGIAVGEIEHADLMPQDPSLIVVDVKVRKGTPVRVDSTASTASQGISGVSAIAITIGTVASPLLRVASASERPVIRGQGGIASFMESGEKIAAGANEAVTRVNRLLSDGNIAALAATIGDLRAVTSELAANRSMIADAASTMARLDRAAAELQATATSARVLIDGDGCRTMVNLVAAAADARLTLHDARRAISRFDRGADEVVPNVNATLLTVS